MSDKLKILIATRVREARIDSGMNQEDAGKAVGVSKSTFNSYEKGAGADVYPKDGRTPKIHTLMECSELFSVSPAWLFGFSDDKTGSAEGWQHLMASGIFETDRKMSSNELAFETKALREKGLNHHDLLLIKVPDNSMTPTLKVDDSALTDTTIQSIDEPGTYVVLDQGGRVWIRHMRPEVTGGFTMYSNDDSKYPPQALSDAELSNLRIVGKVVGMWTWM